MRVSIRDFDVEQEYCLEEISNISNTLLKCHWLFILRRCCIQNTIDTSIIHFHIFEVYPKIETFNTRILRKLGLRRMAVLRQSTWIESTYKLLSFVILETEIRYYIFIFISRKNNRFSRSTVILREYLKISCWNLAILQRYL